MTTYPNSDPSQSPDSKTQKALTIWRIFVAVYILSAAALVFYWEFTNAGLPTYICELQARVFHSDSCLIILNILGSILVFLLPLFILKFIFEKSTGVKIKLGK